MSGFILLIGIFFLIVVIGLPIYIGFLGSSMIFIAIDPRLTFKMIPPILYSGLDSFPIIAIPLFIFAGELMSGGKISDKLLVLSEKIVGWLPGNIGAINTLGSLFFGAVSGSGPATTAAMTGMTAPKMLDTGYSWGYTTSLSAASGFLGVLIPPSIPFVMYGFMTNTSIGDLFIVGIVPGVTIGLLYILWNTYYAVRHDVKSIPTSDSGILKSFKEAIWALFMPVIILGGIYGGIFTPTEAAAVAVGYALIVGFVIYRTLTVKLVIKLAARTAYTLLTFMLIFLFANLFSKIMTLTNMTQMVLKFLISFSNSSIILLLLINFFLLILGMVMDPITGILLVAPLFYPIAVTYLGLDPVHFGAIVVVNLAVGMITPPLAGNLFVAMRITGASMGECIKPLVPFLLIGIAVVLLVTFIPAYPMFILNLISG